ncbi:MAG: CBS domain-containing protein [Myxococcota bacterium]
MSLDNRPISEFMTPHPYRIGVDQMLSRAHQLMREHQIRHLPVLKGGALVGVVTERDLALVEALPGVQADSVTVEEAMSDEVFEVEPNTPFREVVSQMAEHKYGSAIVTERHKLLGVFTTIDALRSFNSR